MLPNSSRPKYKIFLVSNFSPRRGCSISSTVFIPGLNCRLPPGLVELLSINLLADLLICKLIVVHNF